MSDDDILEIAKTSADNNLYEIFSDNSSVEIIHDFLFTFARAIEAKAVEKEREACAEVCDRIEIDKYNLYKGNDPYSKYSSGCNVEYVEGQSDGSSLCATAIRARGE